VAGDAAFGRRVQRLRDTLIYERPWLDLDELAEVRGRQFRQKRAGARNAKYSPGGLVDVEYGVQVLQVRHGRTAPALRTPDLEAAIGELGRRGVVTASEAERLRAADLFLRRLINALRVLRGVAEDLVLPAPDSADAQHLARRMGYSAPDWKIAAEDLEREFADHTAFVRDFVRRCVGEEMLPSRRDLAAAGDRL
jgi:glutamate-ammonia-ligase adenylyltransferase